VLQGRESNQFQVAPYSAVIQVTYFDPQQLIGISSVGEQVTWRKTRMAQPQGF
jgi:hypothetical protein